jgi:hypothetical protein
VSSRTHQGAKAGFGAIGTRLEVHNILGHEVIQEPSLDRAIAACNKVLGEAADVKPFNGLLAIEAAIKKLDVGFRMVGEQFGDLTRNGFSKANKKKQGADSPLDTSICLSSIHTCDEAS